MTYDPKADQETLAARSKQAQQLDRDLEFQPALDTFSLQIWAKGLKKLAEAARWNKDGIYQAVLGILKITVSNASDEGFVVVLFDGTKMTAAAIANGDLTETFHILKTEHTAEELKEVVDHLVRRWRPN